MRKSNVLQKLRAGQPVLMTNAAFTGSAGLCEILGNLGFDCIWIDMEHRPLNPKDVFHMIQGARAGSTDTCVRIVHDTPTGYARLLEDGASGLMIPHCSTANDARRAVELAKFPPLGDRGLDMAGPDGDYLTADLQDYLVHANNETFVVVQIEDMEAVENVDEIAAVEGVDILFIGPMDLTLSMGIPGQTNHPEVQAMVDRVAQAAADHGTHWGSSLGSGEAARSYFERGARFFNIRSDIRVMLQGFSAIKKDFDEHIGRQTQEP